MKQVIDLAEKEGVRKEWLVVQGRLHEAIAEISKQKEVDLIVIGSRGRTGLKDFFMGSVTERVLGHVESVVLVVKA